MWFCILSMSKILCQSHDLADTNNTWPEDLFLYLSLNQSTTL